ncbi:hypothetical protein KBTX_03741 [wastewater metagenome]|uniref:Uncharacterized protein n=2 Tax=unclassified sequences TaxID=12908 RepID=A0A5B8RFI1_9ZZZZ|nr:hypothetical protein KBTEX_03741 [uncultured organism]
MGLLPVAEVQRAATVGEPAHDHPVAPDDLLAVDPEVLPALLRPPGGDQRPGDQRAGIAGPAGLHRDVREVHVVALDHHLLAGCAADLFRRHVQHLLVHRQAPPGVAHALGRIGLLEEGEEAADLAQRLGVVRAHAEGHAAGRSEEVGEHRHVVADRVLEQQGGAAAAQRAVTDLGHLQHRVHRMADALELAGRLQLLDELPKVVILQRRRPLPCARVTILPARAIACHRCVAVSGWDRMHAARRCCRHAGASTNGSVGGSLFPRRAARRQPMTRDRAVPAMAADGCLARPLSLSVPRCHPIIPTNHGIAYHVPAGNPRGRVPTADVTGTVGQHLCRNWRQLSG